MTILEIRSIVTRFIELNHRPHADVEQDVGVEARAEDAGPTAQRACRGTQRHRAGPLALGRQ